MRLTLRTTDGSGEVELAVDQRSAMARFDVTGGLDAGTTVSLATGSHDVGRDDTNDVVLANPTISRRHARLTIEPCGAATIVDLLSTNGTRVGSSFRHEPTRIQPGVPITMGSSQFALAGAPSAGPRRPNERADATLAVETVIFNRPPRMAAASNHPTIVVPDEPRELGGRTPFSWAMLLAPVAIAVVMALAFNPMYALFALLSPVMMVASWYEQRRRAHRTTRLGNRRFAAELETFEVQLAFAQAEESRRRRTDAPDLAPVIERARTGDPRLWERQRHHDDFLCVRLGTVTQQWSPPLDRHGVRDLPTSTAAIIDRHRDLVDAPLVADLSPGHVIGIAGPRSAATAVARSLVAQATNLSGPADVGIALALATDRQPAWAYLASLPHLETDAPATTPTDDRVMITLIDDRMARADHLPPREPDDPRRSARRSAIVIAATDTELPSCCTTVVECLDDLGRARVRFPERGLTHHDVLLMGATAAVAAESARALARFVDPELARAGGSLASCVLLPDVLALDLAYHEAIVERWRSHDPCSLPIVVGAGVDGPLVIDLVRDGPHALIGGTTGSGKSELLRSAVASLVTSASPDDVTLVLIDYKGGSAFDACAALPHTVGLVTDLDDRLGERALLSLEAELRHREAALRSVGAADFVAYRTAPGSDRPPLPRLVVIVDEFATLAAELPSFLDALVSIAQRGRSLGIHLILATQRPHGVISDTIRSNTNIRIALRMLDDRDSVDVLGSSSAAALSRHVPGRAFLRLGTDDVVAFQAAHASATTGSESGASPSDLDRLVVSVAAAQAARGAGPPRRPWLPALPHEVTLGALSIDHGVDDNDGGELVPLGLVDEPRAQRQGVWGWRPAAGNLVILGMPGSGTTTALLTVACALAERHPPDRLHLYAFDFGTGGLDPLVALPHVGAVVRHHEHARQERLLGVLRDELQRRRVEGGETSASSDPAIVVVVDDAGAMRSVKGDLAGLTFLDRLTRLALDGPAFGMHLAITGDRPPSVPPAIVAGTSQRLVLHLADAYDYGLCGLRSRDIGDARSCIPGRGLTEQGLEVQVARVPPAELSAQLTAIANRVGTTAGPLPRTIGELPERVGIELLPATTVERHHWTIPIGIGDRDLRPRSLELHDGDHVLIAGPPRSGRTSLLTAIATTFVEDGCTDRRVLVFASSTDSDLVQRCHDRGLASVEVHTPDELVRETGATDRPTLVLIDDVERVLDVDDAMRTMVTTPDPRLRVVVAGRADRLRSAYGHWTRAVRDSGVGIAIRPDLDVDGDLWSVRFSSLRGATWPAGRAVLVHDGQIELVQLVDA